LFVTAETFTEASMLCQCTPAVSRCHQFARDQHSQ